MRTKVQKITEKYSKDAERLMDMLIDIQAEIGYIADEAIEVLSEALNVSKVDIEQTRSFYHFFTNQPTGEYTVYLNNSAVAVMMGRAEIAKAFEEAAGCKFGSVSEDGKIGLFDTACIGMNDQEPAAIINGKVFTKLTPAKVKEVVEAMKAGKTVDEMGTNFGDGNNELLKAMVNNNIKQKGAVLFADYEIGEGLNKSLSSTPKDVINNVKTSNIRGRGGAGFPTGLKWDFCSQASDPEKYVVCNADEGEPGTFKDRVILTEMPKLLFEGMAIAGYAIQAKEGILYLRNEYLYMKEFLEGVLSEMRNQKLLGENILDKGFNFDIRIQFGAGAYVCGEESALIESAEGKRGEPRNRPPFPVQVGYKGKPTVVNNVETLSSVVKIMINGGEWYSEMGTKETAGTKLLSISGDIKTPGVYEVEWGMTVKEMLEMVGAEDTQAVQCGGPSGTLIGPKEFNRKIAYEDIATGGAMIVIGKDRNLLDIVDNFMEFFIEESCGSCVPCRALTVILKQKFDRVRAGMGIKKDIEELENWSGWMKQANRCGLGQTTANPILFSIKNFREKYVELVKDQDYISEFNMEKAVADSCKYVDRTPKFHHN
jgi:[NiFe] hydrogenase diaphorase moiety large subunit